MQTPLAVVNTGNNASSNLQKSSIQKQSDAAHPQEPDTELGTDLMSPESRPKKLSRLRKASETVSSLNLSCVPSQGYLQAQH